jgi:hypothetical protein
MSASLSPQAAAWRERARVLNFCANNYLGLADHPQIVAAAKAALDEWGFGMASVRFICGTQTQHTELEARLSRFLHTEGTILFLRFDANGEYRGSARRPDVVISTSSTTRRSSTDPAVRRPGGAIATGT